MKDHLIIKKLYFINFTLLSDPELINILHWRNEESIRSKMTNSDIISPEDHLKYCHSLKHNKNTMMFRVDCNDEPCGVITLKKINRLKREAEVGTYYFKSGIVASKCNSLALALYQALGIDTLYSYIKKTNTQAILFNLLKCKCKFIREDDQYLYSETKTFYDPKIYEGIELKLLLGEESYE